MGIKSIIRRRLTDYYRNRGYWNGEKIIKPCTEEEGNKILAEALISGKSFLFSRFGTELLICNCYLSGHGYGAVEEKTIDNAGVFPREDNALNHFCQTYIQSCQSIDYLNAWFWLKSEGTYFRKYCPWALLFPSSVSTPFFYEKTWTKALEGKRVLVIHSAVDTIEQQYVKRKDIWKDKPEILPEFTLSTYRAVQSLGGTTEYSEWQEAFHKMKRDIKKLDFDVAMLGCGAYGLPLAAFIKEEMHKAALHLGGITQIYFGIKGKRWEGKKENYRYDELLYNDAWVRTEEGKPKNYKSVEDGCYW